MAQLAFESQLPFVVRSLQVVEELPSEDPAEDFDGKEELLSRRNPLLAIRSDSTSGNDAMEVWVKIEALTPRVQDRKESDVGTQVLRIPCDLEKRLGGRTKKEAVDETFVLKCDRADVVGKREDDVEIMRLEEIGCSVLKPLGPGLCLTFRAVAIAAGFVEELLVTAAITTLDVPAESGSSASGDVSQDAFLLQGNAVLGDVLSGVLPQDIGHFEPMR
jgi:hypothetical protein